MTVTRYCHIFAWYRLNVQVKWSSSRLMSVKWWRCGEVTVDEDVMKSQMIVIDQCVSAAVTNTRCLSVCV